jgi:mRNA-degrading endonuclease YafQ of YafQ-DinJ toxin-antitoxin module
MQSKYTDIMNQVCKNNNFEPLFNDHEGTGNLTEQEVKELIEI